MLACGASVALGAAAPPPSLAALADRLLGQWVRKCWNTVRARVGVRLRLRNRLLGQWVPERWLADRRPHAHALAAAGAASGTAVDWLANAQAVVNCRARARRAHAGPRVRVVQKAAPAPGRLPLHTHLAPSAPHVRPAVTAGERKHGAIERRRTGPEAAAARRSVQPPVPGGASERRGSTRWRQRALVVQVLGEARSPCELARGRVGARAGAAQRPRVLHERAAQSRRRRGRQRRRCYGSSRAKLLPQ